MKTFDDHTFISMLNKKSKEAFHMLYEDYYRMFVVFALDFVNDRDVAEDLVQELIVSLYEKEIQFENMAVFKSYMYNAVRNNCLNHIRHQDVKSRYASKVQDNPEESKDLHDEIEEQEIYRQLFLVIDNLPDRCKQVFELHLQGKKNQEIAEVLNISIETVKTQKKRALQRIKQQFNLSVLLMLYPMLFT